MATQITPPQVPITEMGAGEGGTTGGIAERIRSIPPVAWFGAAAVAIGIYIYMKRNRESTPEEILLADSGVGLGGDSGYTYTGVGAMANGADSVQIGGPIDNNQWGRDAIDYLITQGYDAALSDEAIRRYLAAVQLSPMQGVLVSVAIGGVGPVPEGLEPGPQLPVVSGVTNPSKAGSTPPNSTTPNVPVKTVVTAPKPAPKTPVKSAPTPAKPKVIYKYHTVRPGETLSKIGKKYGKSYTAIFNANKKGEKRKDGTPGILTNPNMIRVGQKLLIP